MINKFKDFIWLVIGGIGLIILVFIASKYMGLKQYKPAIAEGSKFEYVIHTEYKDRPIYITKIKAKVDTLYETIFVGDNSSHTSTIVAKADTVLLADSTQIGITYYFPPRNYFDIRANIKEKIITRELTITKPYDPSFWDRFQVVLYAGAGWDFIQKSPSISMGLGFGINLKRIF